MDARARRGCTRLTALLLVLAAPVWPCEPVAHDKPHVERAPDGRGVRISYRARMMVPLDSVEQVLTDPSRFHEWLPGVAESSPTAEGFIAVYQLPWPLGRVKEVMGVERSTHPDGTSLRWHRISGDFLRDESCWRLRQIDPTTTEVSYAATLQLHKWVPVSLVRRAQRRALPRAAAALEARAADL